MSEISLQFGNENQVGASCKVQTFRLEDGGTEAHASRHAAEGGERPYQIINKDSVTAVNDQPWEVGGGWTTMGCSVTEGAIFKIYVSRKPRIGIPATFCVLIRIRESAPLIQVRVPGLNLVHSTTRHVTAFLGRGDFITLLEAKAAGFQSKLAYEKFFDHPDAEDTLVITELAPGVKADPVVARESVDDAGNKVVRFRKVELRRIRRRKSPKGG